METRFSYDFSRVRVHTDARGEDSAQALAARAYTSRENIVFARSSMRGHCRGQKTAGHELTHVVQQNSPGGLPERIIMRQSKPVETKFSGCTGNQPKQINAAVQDAKAAN